MLPATGQSSTTPPITSRQGSATPRRLRKPTMNRHSMFASGSGSQGGTGAVSGGSQQGAPVGGPSPSPTSPTSPTNQSRSPHGRSTSLLNFSFRNRASQHQQQPLDQQQQQAQQQQSQLRQNGQTGMNEFGRMSSPLAGQQRGATVNSTTSSRPSLEAAMAANGQQTQTATTSTNGNGGQATPAGNGAAPPAPPKQLHPEIRSIVQLSVAHAHKVYYSGPLVKHIERHADGRVVGKEEPWRDVWAQLGGTTLSVWDMAEIAEANKRGAEVPPTYLNVTDASIHVLGAVTMPDANGNPIKHLNVITLTTAGMNLILFSCPSPQALIAWTAALRLAAYEKSRLEEMYTAHLLRMSLSENGVWKDPRSPLLRGRLEGWVQIRLSGQTDWKRLWMVLQSNNDGSPEDSPGLPKRNRMSSLFGRATHQHQDSNASVGSGKSLISLYLSQKPKDRKRPVLMMENVTQVFGVYPERPELISRSTLLKIEGFFGDEELAGDWRRREGWLLLMPEAEPGKLGSLEMLKWLVGLHDAFCLYGRPTGYTWNPRDPVSLMFSYPVGPAKNNLFMEREEAESVDPREDRGSEVRQKFKEILIRKLYGQGGAPANITPMSSPAVNGMFNTGDTPPSLPPIASVAEEPAQPQPQPQPQPQSQSRAPQLQQNVDSSPSFQLPPFSFDNPSQPAPVASPPTSGQGRTSLTPITERSKELSEGHAGSLQEHTVSPPSGSGSAGGSLTRNVTASPIQEEGLGGPVMESPTGGAKPYDETRQIQSVSPPIPPQPARKFSQESGSSSGVRLVSPTRMVNSPLLDESRRVGSPSSDAANVRLPTSSVQSPASEQAPSISSQTRFSPKPAPSTPPPNPSITMVAQPHQSPNSPMSERSRTSVLSSPFSQEGMGGISMSLERDRPPAPPSKSPLVRPSVTMSPQQSASTSNSSWQQPTSRSSPPRQQPEYVFNEDGALYYINQNQQDSSHTVTLPTRPSQSGTADSEESDDDHSMLTNPMSVADTLQSPTQHRPLPSSPPIISKSSAAGDVPPRRQQTPMGFEHLQGQGRSGSPGADSGSAVSAGEAAGHLAPRTALGRKPSGARALPPAGTNRRFESSTSLNATPEEQPQQPSYQQPSRSNAQMSSPYADDDTVDALAALSFLEQNENNAVAPSAQSPPQRNGQAAEHPIPAPPTIMEPEERAPSPQVTQYKSSFAPSKQAAERKARSQAQQAAHEAVLHKPGRPNGKQRTKPREGGWESSEDEEEEEEEEEEEDGDEEDEDRPRGASASRSSHGPSIAAPVGRNPAIQQQMRGLSPSNSGLDPRDQYAQNQQYQQRPLRTLPQIPRGRSPGGSEDHYGAQGRRYMSDQYTESGRRPYDESHRETSIGRPQAQYPSQLGASRSNMFNAVLDAGRDPAMPLPNQNNTRDTFIQMESPSETMTKAFTPQGLLSAGLQDKQDRSAKRQEEVARETGASLINVPNKPPEPQVGLLGAISAHERERKREGGMGAALTEREREKRLAEDRQRKLDDFQRQQLEQQQQMAAQGGMYPMSMYGMGGLTPQMTGMNPMMNGMFPMGGNPSMFFNPMMNPMMMNPQHMFAAQQAAQAYQQAMIAMSTAGSQVGGEGGGGGSPNGGGGSPAPMMGNMGYDPRMSMMSMGMPMGMGMGMGMGLGGMPGMGTPMGMQMTGNSSPGGGFDSRFSLGPNGFDGSPNMNNFNTGLNPGSGHNSGQASQRVSSYNDSPAGSPAPGDRTRKDSEAAART